MSDLVQARPPTLLDAAWRTAFRLGFPLARIWWRLRRRNMRGRSSQFASIERYWWCARPIAPNGTSLAALSHC